MKLTSIRKLTPMILENELRTYGCELSPDEFSQLSIKTLEIEFTGYTIDDLLCDPSSATEYLQRIQVLSKCKTLIASVILKSLINIRKRSDCPPGLRGSSRPRRLLKRDLPAAECVLTPTEFKEMVSDCFASMYKSLTIDGLLCHPKESGELCDFIRVKAKAKLLPDNLILKTLMGNRKNTQ